MLSEIRQTLRSLAGSPAFSFTNIVSLGIGIGVCTAAFSSMRALFFTPLPYPEPDRIVEIWSTPNPASRQRIDVVTLDRMRAWTDDDFRTLETLAARGNTSLVLDRDVPERVSAEVVSGAFFEVLGVEATLGRTLGPDDDRPDAQPAVVLSESLWRRRFDGEASVLGRSIDLSGSATTIVGVMPESFEEGERVWVAASDFLALGSVTAWYPIARLRDGASLADAIVELQQRTAAEIASDSSYAGGMGAVAIPIGETARNAVGSGLWIGVATVVGIYLLAITNLTTLFLARAAQRSRAAALRMALGATSWQLGRSLLLESVILAGAGAILGLVLAAWGKEVIRFAMGLSLVAAPSFDILVFGFAVGLSLLSASLVGLEPLRHLLAADVRGLLQGTIATSAGPQQRFTRNAMIALQVATVVTFACIGGVFSVAYARFAGFDLGYDADRVVMAVPDYDVQQVGPADQAEIASAVVDRLAARPGVDGATLWRSAMQSYPPRPEQGAVFEGGVDRYPGRSGLYRYYDVGPDFFRTLGIDIVGGRDFRREDRPAAPAVGIVSEGGARVWWPGQDPIGRRLRLGETGEWITVVGITRDAAQLSALGRDFAIGTLTRDQRHFPILYRPIAQSSAPPEGWVIQGSMLGLDGVVLGARASDRPGIATETLRAEIFALAPGTPLRYLGTLQDYQVGASTGRMLRLFRGLLTALAMVGLFLAMLGIAGGVAESLVRRTREIGVRKALGAGPRHVTFTLARESALTAAVGLSAGLFAVVIIGQVVARSSNTSFQRLLVGGSLTDVRVIAGVGVSVLLVTALVSGLCARRANRIEPVDALRAE